MGHYLGIDVGGSHVSGVCIDSGLRMVKGAKTGFAARRKRKIVLQELGKIIDELSQGLKAKGIGIGVPGPVKDGVMFWSCNSTFMEDTDFRKFAGKWSKKVVVDNDVNCMAFGEMAKRKAKNLLAVTLGTGVGGGMVIDGRLHNGRPYAGEVGHMTIDPTGIRCTCGSRGCWQEYAGSRGVERLSEKHLGRTYSPDRLYALAAGGDRNARKAWEEYGRFLGIGLSNLCSILDPEMIVLGGGISEAFGLFEKSMLKEMKSRLHMKPPKIEKGMEHSVAFGAACMAMKA
jgi:glucokinase